jgi:hypothetical protein
LGTVGLCQHEKNHYSVFPLLGTSLAMGVVVFRQPDKLLGDRAMKRASPAGQAASNPTLSTLRYFRHE